MPDRRRIGDGMLLGDVTTDARRDQLAIRIIRVASRVRMWHGDEPVRERLVSWAVFLRPLFWESF